MVDFFLQRYVFYPTLIVIVVVFVGLRNDARLTTRWSRGVGLGVILLCVGVVLALLDGAPISGIPDVFLFTADNFSKAYQVISFGYMLIFGSLVLRCRSVISGAGCQSL